MDTSKLAKKASATARRFWDSTKATFNKTPSMEIDELIKKTYKQRQLVLFTDRSVGEEIGNELDSSKYKGWWTFMPTLRPIALGSALYAGYKVYIGSFSLGDRNGLILPKTLIHHFVFPPGHPEDRVLYVGHPFDPKRYYPVGSFHRYLLEDKFLEAIRILEALGAKKIFVENADKGSQKKSVKIAVGKGKEAIDGSLSQREHESTLLRWQAEYKGHDNPSLPEGLAWYPNEKIWHYIVETRLKRNATSCALNLQYEEDYGIDLKLKSKIEGLGLELGGAFETSKSINWVIKGEF